MKYGLIGERLGHSFSKIIHEKICDYTYELCEIEKEALPAFFAEREFDAINVTIPYKEAVMPLLDYIHPDALAIGSVNTVIKRNGRLEGYNTDIYGIKALIDHAGVCIRGKKVIILGTGGTSRTAMALAGQEGAREVYRVSRSGKDGALTYEELYEKHTDAEVIINTTPLGMYPNPDASPVDPEKFPRLEGAIDAIYNPLRTRFILAAKKLGLSVEGGLYMLVAQAVRAIELFTGSALPDDTAERVYRELSGERENIVLIGMPSSGKSSVGRAVAERLGRVFIDTDELITEMAGRDIPSIIREDGESRFRDIESEAVARAAMETGAVIATGGGAVLREENVTALSQNGRIYFIDRPLELLTPTGDRPLTSDRDALTKKYNERYPIYAACAESRIDGSGSVNEVADRVIKEFCK